jgi:hypothetical protein
MDLDLETFFTALYVIVDDLYQGVDIYGHLVPGGNKAALDRPDHAPIRNYKSTTESTLT